MCVWYVHVGPNGKKEAELFLLHFFTLQTKSPWWPHDKYNLCGVGPIWTVSSYLNKANGWGDGTADDGEADISSQGLNKCGGGDG